jgi:hypothetical protein
MTKKEPTRKVIADEEVPFSLGTCEEGHACFIVRKTIRGARFGFVVGSISWKVEIGFSAGRRLH